MKNLRILFLVLSFSGFLATAQKSFVPHYGYEPLSPDSVQLEVEVRVAAFLKNYHFNKFEFDDSLSSNVWDNYISNIDGGKLYFTKSDIDSFEKYRYSIDEALQYGNLDAAFDVFNTYRKIYKARAEYIENYLSQPFNYNSNEMIKPNRDKARWAMNTQELDKEWDKILLNQAVSLKLTGKSDSAIAATLKNRYNILEKRTSAYKSENVFQFFLNSFTEYLDPHTNYMIPPDAESFNISMSQSIEGIGASLTNEGDYVIIKSIVPGGPLFKSGEGNVEDYIVGVAQGEDGEFQDIIGWLTDDAIKLIRGKKGTIVQLKLLASSAPLGTQPRVVRLVRDKIKLEEAVAKGKVVDLEMNNKAFKLGVIDIPMFYRDFEYANQGKDFQSTSADVKKILKDFSNQKVDGVLVDLRNNGGGSLIEAIDLTGLFIKNGPVVQRRSSIGQSNIEYDNDKNIYFEGPLVILQNRFSASASEIFAGAIQDYQRGLIVGENSFGKGTVQQLVNLDSYFARLNPSRKKLSVGIGNNNNNLFGQLKFTSEKFYRITGNSTQIRGVSPDVALPSAYGLHELGEESYKRAMTYDEIQPTSFDKLTLINKDVVNKLNKQYEKRVGNDEAFKELLADIEEYKAQKNIQEYSLNYEIRKKEMDDDDNKRLSIKKLAKSTKDEDKDNDIYLLESEKILADLIMLKKS